MPTSYHNSDALWLEQRIKSVCYLFRKPFLHLQTAGEHLRDAGELGETDYMVVGNVSDMYLLEGQDGY
jgi:hypothetical protein